MKSIERRYKNIVKENRSWSSYMCFAEAIKKQGFNEQIISRWFKKLVNKNDYAKNEKKQILSFCLKLSNPLRRT